MVLSSILITVLGFGSVSLDHQEQEVLCLTQALYHESSSEGQEGMFAVGTNARARVDSKRYSARFCEVLHQRSQYSYYNDGKPEVKTKQELTSKIDQRAFDLAYSVAYSVVVDHQELVSVSGATVYYACDGPWKIDKPSFWDWTKLTFRVKINNHCYYEEV